MSKFGSKEEIVSSIQALFENMQAGSFSADEMESLVELSRELHERALILRYKSYEEKVFGVAPSKTETETEMVEVIEEVAVAEEMEEEVSVLSFEAVEEEILAHENNLPSNDEPVFDFDMFEKAEEDIFSPEMAIEPVPEIISFEEDSLQNVVADEMPTLTPISNVVIEQEINSEENFESTPIFSESTPKEEIADAIDTDMFNRFSNTDDSLSGRLMSSKLQTLVGSFGLNDKLQCIRELFKGSSEAFNLAIDQLDSQPDFNAAKRVLAQYAQQYSWDLESNLTAEFIQKVERRYL